MQHHEQVGGHQGTEIQHAALYIPTRQVDHLRV